METENKDWKPEVGGKAWIVWASTFQFCEIRQVVVGKEIRSLGATYFDVSSQMNGGFCKTKHIDSIFPTIEKAQESFEVYDLEGKEVLIPRAQDKIIDEMCARAFEQIAYLSDWDDADYARLGMAPIINAFKAIIAVKDKAVIKRLIDVAYKMELPPNPDGEARLKAAQERFKSAIGGKSDAREGGC